MLAVPLGGLLHFVSTAVTNSQRGRCFCLVALSPHLSQRLGVSGIKRQELEPATARLNGGELRRIAHRNYLGAGPVGLADDAGQIGSADHARLVQHEDSVLIPLGSTSVDHLD